MLELLALHVVVLNSQIFMILWKLMKKWHHLWWKSSWTISSSRKLLKKRQKNPLEWWRVHEVQFSYVGFVAWQILGTVGSQIEAQKVFYVASICTNFWRSWDWMMFVLRSWHLWSLLHGHGGGPYGRKWVFNWLSWAFGHWRKWQ